MVVVLIVVVGCQSPSPSPLPRDKAVVTHSMGSTCSYIQVQPGDSCTSLIPRCAITAEQFFQYNPHLTGCSTLVPRQPICCSEGGLPDLRPQKNSDGTCPSDSIRRTTAERWNTTDPQQIARYQLDLIYDFCMAIRMGNNVTTETHSTNESSIYGMGQAFFAAQADRFGSGCQELGITV